MALQCPTKKHLFNERILWQFISLNLVDEMLISLGTESSKTLYNQRLK